MSAKLRPDASAYDRKNLRWNGWGAEGAGFPFGEREPAIWQWIEDVLGGEPLTVSTPPDWQSMALPTSLLSAEDVTALSGIVGEEHVHLDAYERIFHAFGRSFHDLIRVRQGRVGRAPDAVIYPADHDQVQRVLSYCQARAIDVIPFGGGSSVVGGVEPNAASERPILTLDTTKMQRVLALDPIARTATVQTGIYGPDLENALQSEGLTLGHYPQSFQYSTLGGWIAARSSGQQSAGYGNASKWLVAARMATPRGELKTQIFPNSAAGPDLNQWIAGSEGTLGVITEATLRLSPLPAYKNYQGVLFPSFEAGTDAVRAMVQAGLPMAMIRLSDAEETKFFGAFGSAGKSVSRARQRVDEALAGRGYGEQKAIMLLGVEGSFSTTRWAMARALGVCVRHRGIPLGTGMGEKWYAGRFDMPFLREPMLDRGIGVETLETATTWSNLPHLHAELQSAIRRTIGELGGSPALVMGHISHAYPVGASLYFTFVWKLRPGHEIDDWLRIKTAASETIAANGGTISHHHGVGVDHQPWMLQEKGALSIAALQAAKRANDPHAIMNPGKLLPALDGE